jgi:hypothetical protein
MKQALLLGIVIVVLASTGLTRAGSSDSRSAQPEYTSDNRLVRPQNYREWIYLSSGLGMNYGPVAGPETFTNVFVPEVAYSAFKASGKWPDKTIFVVEERAASSVGSINKSGHFQADIKGIGVEVKDAGRFPDKWAYFIFAPDAKVAEATPKAACWQCHEDHAAVEHTFVQFYPTLKPIAQKFGTYKQSAEASQKP